MRDTKSKALVLGLLMATLLLSGWTGAAQAQQKYPTKAIEVIVPWTAGGGADLSARLMADYLSTKWGVRVNVVNKPGGLTVPAQLELYNAKPDGYTIFHDGGATSSQLIAVVKNPPFNIMDRTFICNITINPLLYIVQYDSPIKSMKDVETEAKKDPSNFTWASLGGTSGIDFTQKKFLKAIGVDFMTTKPVMSKGGSEAVNHVAAGSVKVGVGSVSGARPAIASKLVRPLAVATTKRLPDYPDIPTVGEAGYPAAVHQDRFGPSGPPKLPSQIVEIWEKAIEEMLKNPEFISKLNRIGQVPFYTNAQETRQLVLREMEETKELLGIK